MHDPLADALFTKAQAAVLDLLFGHPGESFYLRDIITRTGLGVGHVQRTLASLAATSILEQSRVGRHVFFQANPRCPIYHELRAIVAKTLGPAARLRAAMSPLRDRIHAAFIYGSIARGTENRGSDIDLMVVGNVSFAEVVDAARAAEAAQQRPINPTVYPAQEFHDKLAHGNHFLRSVVAGEKLFLIGGENELGPIPQERLDTRARHVTRRNRQPAGHR